MVDAMERGELSFERAVEGRGTHGRIVGVGLREAGRLSGDEEELEGDPFPLAHFAE